MHHLRVRRQQLEDHPHYPGLDPPEFLLPKVPTAAGRRGLRPHQLNPRGVEFPRQHPTARRPAEANPHDPVRHHAVGWFSPCGDESITIYVEILPFDITPGDLNNLFALYGRLTAVRVWTDRDASPGHRVGFVDLADGGRDVILGLDGYE
jgi:hypothetical protein